MNWKILLVSVIAVISIIVLGLLQIIGIPQTAILSGIISVIGIVIPLFFNLNKPNISLSLEEPKFEKRTYGEEIVGYKLVTKVISRGKKIVYNLEASIIFENPMELIRVSIQTRNQNKKYGVSKQKYDPKNYSWIDIDGKDTKNQLLDSLRKDDEMRLMFPKKSQSGPWVASIGGGDRINSFGIRNDILCKLEPEKTYKVEIEIKGEDNEKVTVCKSKKFKIKFSNDET